MPSTSGKRGRGRPPKRTMPDSTPAKPGGDRQGVHEGAAQEGLGLPVRGLRRLRQPG